MAIPSLSEMFKRVCGYTTGNYYRKSYSHLKWLKIGDAMLQIETLYNKQIRVQKVSFEINPDGKVSAHAGGSSRCSPQTTPSLPRRRAPLSRCLSPRCAAWDTSTLSSGNEGC